MPTVHYRIGRFPLEIRIEWQRLIPQAALRGSRAQADRAGVSRIAEHRGGKGRILTPTYGGQIHLSAIYPQKWLTNGVVFNG